MKTHLSKFTILFLILLFSGLNVLGQVPNYVPTNGLVAYWPFNGNANDESGNGNHGTVNGATLTTDRFGVANKAYFFSSSGCSTRIDASVNTTSIQTGLTISIWVLKSGNGCIGPRLFEFWPGNNGPGIAQWGWDNSTTLIGMGSQTSSGFNCNFGVPIKPVNQWTHLVYTNNGTVGKFYQDGILLGTVNSTGNPILASSLAMGRMNHPAYDAFNGKLDDMCIWNRALTQQEISALHTSNAVSTAPTCSITTSDSTLCLGQSTTLSVGSTPSSSSTNCGTLTGSLANGLVGYWPFCGNANDLSGNGNNGTVNGATLTTDRFGNANSAYSFDGLNDYINVVNPTILNFQPGVNFSVSFYYNPNSTNTVPNGFNGLIARMKSDNNGPGNGWQIGRDNNNFRLEVGCAPTLNSVINNTWVNITMVFNRNLGQVEYYQNGVLISIYSCSNIYSNFISNHDLKFGVERHGLQFTSGLLDDIAIWNRALTVSEIQQLYTQGQSTYSWSPGGATTPTITVSPTQTTTYTVTTTVNGVSCSDAITVTVDSLNFSLPPTTTVCGTATTLTAPAGATSYLWNTGATTAAISPTTSGSYSCTVTQGACVKRDTTQVTLVNSTITATDSTLCLGQSTTLSVANVTTSNPILYSITKSVNNTWSVNWPVTIGGNYQLKVVGTYGIANGNQGLDAAFVTANQTPYNQLCTGYQDKWLLSDGCPARPTPDVYNSNNIYYYNIYNSDGSVDFSFSDCCMGDNSGSLYFELTNLPITYFYNWSPGGATTPSITVSPTQTTTYTVTTTVNGVSCSDAITVTVDSLNFSLPPTTTVCGTTTTLSAPTGATSYLWNTGATTAAISPTTSGFYSCIVIKGACVKSDTTQVTLVNSTITTTDSTLCLGQSTTLSVGSTPSSSSTNCGTLTSSLANGLVGYWPFCGNANDLSGNGNNGTVNGATLTTDRFGNANSAYSFDGVNDYINVGNANMLNSNIVSISAWFNAVDYGSQAQLYQGNLVSKREQSGWGGAYQLALNSSPSNVVYAPYTISGQNGNVFSTTQTTNQWIHVLYVHDLNSARIYINGVLSGTTNVIGGLTANNLPVWFGARPNAGSLSHFLNGKLDDVGIWNRALSNSEIQQLYNLTNQSQVTYSWSPGGATTPTITVSPTQTTTYTVTTTVNGVSCSDAITVTVDSLNFSLPPTTTVCGTTTTLTAPAGATSYLWNTGATTAAISPTTSGSYSCIVTKGACSVSDTTQVTLVNSTITTTDSTLCLGQSTTLSVTEAQGSIGQSCSGVNTYNFVNWTAIAPIDFYSNIISENNTFYLRSQSDVFQSQNLNGPWSSMGFASQVGIIGAGRMLGFDWSNRLQISTYHAALYVQNGTSWQANGLSGFGCSGNFIQKLANNRIIVMKAGFLRDLYISDNNGTSWTNVTNVDNDYWDLIVANDGTIFSCGGSNTPSMTGLIKSSNNGSSFTQINSQLGINYCSGLSKDCEGNLYAVADNKIFKSTNNGSTWVQNCLIPSFFTSNPGGSFFVKASNGDYYLWASASTALTGFFKSNDQGITWSQIIDVPIGPNGSFNMLKELNGNIIAVTPAGVFAKSILSNASYSWSPGGATTPTISVSPTQTTTYTVTTTVNGVSCSDAITVTVDSLNFSLPPTTTVCGTTTTLSAPTGATSYLWNTGATTAAISPTTSGSYSCTVTQGACSVSDTTQLTLMDPSISASDTLICLGQNTILSVSSAGASPTSICTASSLPSNLQTGLAGYWPFCGNANDESGIGNHGIVNGASLTVNSSNQLNSAYSFNGSNQTINFTSPFFNGGQTNSFTFKTRILFNSISNNPNVWGKTFFWGEVNFFVDQNGAIYFRWANSLTGNKYSTIFSNPGIIQVNNWYDITVTFSNGSGQIYLNGILLTTNVQWVAQGGSVLSNSVIENSCNYAQDANSSKIGLRVTGGSPGNYLNGIMDDFAIWNRSLSATEVQQLNNINTSSQNYSWSPGGATTPTITVSPTQTTTYTVTTTVNGVSCSDSLTIVVDTALAVVTLSGPTTFCASDSLQLTANPGLSYQWSTNETTQSITVNQSGTYSVIVTNASGCTAYSTNTAVTVQPLPVVFAGNDTSICFADTLTLVGSGATSYSWNAGVSNGIAFVPTSSATYTLTGIDTNGCVNTDQINITVNPLPTINAGADQFVCIGASATLQAVGGVSYSWNNGISDNTPFTPTNTLNYTVTGTDINGCVNTDQVSITVNPLPNVSAGQDQALCLGTSLFLNGSGAATYSWNNGVINNNLFTPTATTTYTVTGTDINGCVNSDQVVVTVHPLPIVSAGYDTTVCAGEPLVFSGSGAGFYLWNNGITNATTFSATTTSAYVVTGIDNNNCIDTDTLQLIVEPLPVISASPDIQICAGELITLSATSNGTIQWNNGVIDNTPFQPTTTSVYTVSSLGTNGCENTEQVLVTVNPLPNANFNTPYFSQGSPNTTFNFTNTSTNSDQVVWDFGDGVGSSTMNNPMYTYPLVSGTYPVTLIVVSDFGCTDTVMKIVRVINNSISSEVIIPTGFSPNNDGANDTWTITGLANYPQASINVFNRWGQKIFEGNSTNYSWDGTFNNQLQPVADYYYIIELNDATKYNGIVTLKY
jgi:gliding motility-associated-like protein